MQRIHTIIACFQRPDDCKNIKQGLVLLNKEDYSGATKHFDEAGARAFCLAAFPDSTLSLENISSGKHYISVQMSDADSALKTTHLMDYLRVSGARYRSIMTYNEFPETIEWQAFDDAHVTQPDSLWKKYAEIDPDLAMSVLIHLDASKEDIIRLLDQGADPEARILGRHLIEIAADTNQDYLVEMLLARGAKPDAQSILSDLQGEEGNTALHHAATREGSAMLSRMLLVKPNINLQNAYGNTPLHEALLVESLQNARLLIRIGADLEIRNQAGLTPFLTLLGSEMMKLEELRNLCEEMLSQGSMLHEECIYGGNALWYAAANPDLIQYLKEKGLTELKAPENAYDGNLFYDLDVAIRVDDRNKLEELSEQIKASLTPIQKNQLLFAAVDYERFEAAKMLIERGADTSYQTVDGLTLCSVAMKTNQESMMSLVCGTH
jgi:ankyrin repeat protein